MKLKRWQAYAILIVLIPLYRNCGDVNIERDTTMSAGAIGGSFCAQKSDSIKSRLKFVFVMDRSGSNQVRYTTDNPPQTLPGTDPLGNLRFNPLMDFIRGYAADPNVYWSMVNFSSSANVVGSGFTSDSNAFFNTVQQQKNNTQTLDTGWTDYLKALAAAQKLIQDDITKAKDAYPLVASTYVVFFISDGAPIIDGNVMQDQTKINSTVAGLLALKSQNPTLVEAVRVNTGFYYTDSNPDAEARNRLNQMAQNGYGEYLEFGGGASIDFTRYAALVRKQKFDVKEIWFVNTSVVWEGNQLMLDSDSDGLSDKAEAELGSNPNLADSDGNGVSDAVEFKLFGKPCKDPKCSKAGANSFVQCNNLPKDATGAYLDRDGDGLNDCEETLLGSDPVNFDTNNDYLPDGLAFRYGLSLLPNAHDLYLDPDSDGVDNYTEIKNGTPLQYRNSGVNNLMYGQLYLNKDSATDVQSCYSFDAATIPMIGNNNKIAVYLIENTSVVNENRIMRKAEGRVVDGAVNFTDADFH